MDRVQALRKTWRKSAEHFAEQLYRFIRLALFASVIPVTDWFVQVVLRDHKFDWMTLLTAVVPVLETSYRQVYPALGAAKVDSAPGTVTTVTTGVIEGDGLDAVPVPVNTDNGPRPEDGDQSEVSQDPNMVPQDDGDTVFQAPADNSDPVEEGS